MKSNENEENQTSVEITLASHHEFSSDSDKSAWDFYLKYYGESLYKEGKIFLFSNKVESIEVNGDVSFNIDSTVFNKGTKLYESILKETNISEGLKDSLGVIRYSPLNISIMPKTGGLNIIKKSLGNDRFDTFAYFINQYYEGFKTPIINAGSLTMGIGNRLILEKFLDSYKTAGEFFEDIYGIDETFVNELIESGKSLITNKEEYCAYIKLAHKYWCYRLNHEKMTNLLDNQKIIQYKDHLNTILKEIEILENSINKK
ncbi:hypothetical protein [Streptococcus oralis]|jgi:hypothetical protein|uniref:hypothetical protein n=1 Tax=Streptococcus oralis TaxID=1303 RepID=UPI0001CC5B83|nr:hypothetical protein [Streptococcus oralis]EFE56796.1 hypothetical protein HMPREF8579_0756 [Streptococcus oralis ATCC 35037]EFO02228.1 hypothetical protein SMSK23_0995 [Streptococcus oralis ATCC 35037]KZX03253.1 hypothetical protein A4222_06215 [Streptococcus oralis]OOR78671.1 hypothetical protein B0176_02680 [Streptococcus oralis]QQB72387.1 hypothetical protein I6H77_02130 [Streptococcus oralis]